MVIDVLNEFEPAAPTLSLSPAIQSHIAEVRKASWVNGWDAHKGMVAAIQGLREAASGSGALPCFV